jgi:beta-galactosidase
MTSRREFLSQSVLAAAALAATSSEASALDTSAHGSSTAKISLCGKWQFQTDPRNVDYRGVAWYRRTIDPPSAGPDAAIRLEFEAVFHIATVWVNGQLAGEHARKGYTAFCFDITPMLRWDRPNVIAVRVDSAFNDHMLPRERSSDWANDGGIFRPVHLLVSPKTLIDHLHVEAAPNLSRGEAEVTITAQCQNTSAKPWTGAAAYQIFDDETGLIVARAAGANLTIKAGASEVLTLHATVPNAKLWHFDSPYLYRLEFHISDGHEEHQQETTFGIRKFEIKDGRFVLNGEPVRLMGVERMAGSNPEFGMAEPTDWIDHDHRDMKNLNCVFTRVHWPQDRRVLDHCDQHGILMQLEIPAWGPDTFVNADPQTAADIVQNGLEQLREMIESDRNHPSVVVWGLCNEIDGQNPAAYKFAQRMLEEAKRLDPGRLCSYASNSLGETPGRDVAGLMDFIETNEYFGSWAKGDAHAVEQHLEALHAAFPGKPIVISEYGYCACTPDRPEGDDPRIEILRTHDEVFRTKDFVGGAIFFCYNDYRTHIGDRGVGTLRERVHGVVDVYGVRKPSFAVLERELSPVESITITKEGNTFHLAVKTRGSLPSYTLRGYKACGVLYGQGDIPVEEKEVALPDLPPGKAAEVDLIFSQTDELLHMNFSVTRPTGFAVYSLEWKS